MLNLESNVSRMNVNNALIYIIRELIIYWMDFAFVIDWN